jgi:hypothetical protein
MWHIAACDILSHTRNGPRANSLVAWVSTEKCCIPIIRIAYSGNCTVGGIEIIFISFPFLTAHRGGPCVADRQWRSARNAEGQEVLSPDTAELLTGPNTVANSKKG